MSVCQGELLVVLRDEWTAGPDAVTNSRTYTLTHSHTHTPTHSHTYTLTHSHTHTHIDT